jgi:hypothetical protein
MFPSPLAPLPRGERGEKIDLEAEIGMKSSINYLPLVPCGRGGRGVRGSFAQPRQNCLHYFGDVCFQFCVPEPHDTKALRLEPARAGFVVGLLIVMAAAVCSASV